MVVADVTHTVVADAAQVGVHLRLGGDADEQRCVPRRIDADAGRRVEGLDRPAGGAAADVTEVDVLSGQGERARRQARLWRRVEAVGVALRQVRRDERDARDEEHSGEEREQAAGDEGGDASGSP